LKQLILILTIAITVPFSSCRLDEWTKFSLFYAGNASFLSNSDTLNWHEISTNTFDLDFTEDLDLHGSKDKQVEEALLHRVEMHVIEPVSTNFSFLDKVEVYLVPGDGAPIKIASDEKLYAKSVTPKIFVPIISDIDMEDILRNDDMKYIVRYTLHDELTESRHIKVNIKVRVDSRRFGL
jgi:hypothetical protein